MIIKTLQRGNALLQEMRGLPHITSIGVNPQLSIFSVLHDLPRQPLLQYLTKLDVIMRERGITGAIKWNKTVRNCFTRWLVGDPLASADGVKISKRIKGIPKILEGFWIEDRFDPRVKNILTLLCITRAIPGGKDLGLQSITGDYTGTWTDSDWDPQVFEKFRRRVVNTKKGWKPPVDQQNPWILTTKNGPSGHSLTTCYEELKLLDRGIQDAMAVILGESTIDHIRRINFHLFKDEESDHLGEVTALFGLKKVSQPKLAKISTIPDREGKSRNIAMGSYWVQVALNPLHNWAIRALKGIPEDCTYDQGKSVKVLVKEPGHSYWSLDLTAATDRFPVRFQTMMISSLFGEAYGEAWRRLVSLEFHHRSGIVRYAVGQPIGFLSSWSIFALAHHLVMYQAGKKAKISVRSKYVILGDDVVICDDRLAVEYKEIMKSLGVEISPLKTHVSKDTYEFAKRWYRDGKEVTPFPILAYSDKKFTTVLSAVLLSRERGWLTELPISEACTLFLAMITGHTGPGYIDLVKGKFDLYYTVYRAIKGYTSWTEVWNSLRFARRELANMRSSLQDPKFGDHLYRLVLFVMFYTDGIGRIVAKSKELKSRFSGKVFWNSDLKMLPASTEEGEFFNSLPQVIILERLKDHMLRAISNADTMEPEVYFKTLLGKNKEEPIGLLTSDLSTLLTQRTQPTGWTVLNSLVNKLSILASRMRKTGMTFGEEGRLPESLYAEILDPIMQYGDHVSADNRGDPIVSYYHDKIVAQVGSRGDPVTPPWLVELYEEEEKSHSAYYGSDITFNWS